MKNIFKGVITSFKNYTMPFQIYDGRLYLDVSGIPSYEINNIDCNGNEHFGGVPKFNQEFLKGRTDDGLTIKLHVGNYYDGDYCFDSYHYIYGNILSCIVLEKDFNIDKIGFYSYEINKITGHTFTGRLTKENLKSLKHNENLAEYIENGHKYYVNIDFLEKEPFVDGQVIAIESDETLTQLMIEDIYWTMRKFFAFVYQRREVPLSDVVLYCGDSVIGHLLVKNSIDNIEMKFEVKCIQIANWGMRLSDLFKALVDKKIYLRHLPSIAREKHEYTTSRYLMTVVGFESTLNLCKIKPNYSDKHKQAVTQAKNTLQELCESSSGDLKKEYKRLYKIIDDERFSDKVITALNEHSKYISNFYQLNRVGKNNSVIAKKISKSRNSFAHGKLEEDLTLEHVNECDFLDLFILYLQLIYIGFDQETASEIVPQILFEH